MRTLFLALLIGLLTFSFMVSNAEAKRFGGGKSFGMSRQASSSPAKGSHTAPAQGAAKPASTASKWLGPLAGLAIGGLLASLFMGHGFGSGLLMWLVIGLGAFFIWRLIRSKLQPPIRSINDAHFQAHPANNSSNSSSMPSFLSNVSSGSGRVIEHIPDFDTEAFLRQAKALFIRLQAAYDSKNLTDIREFTAPQVFAEIQLQIQERGNAINQTEVISIDDEIIDRSDDGKLISVLFSGLIREEANAEPVSIREIWHFEKNPFNSNWIVAGIQQE